MERTSKKISDQVKEHAQKTPEEPSEYEGDLGKMISTGSTLLDLAMSGGRVRGGGLPAGIIVEISGLPSSGKTVMLCEIAGNIHRRGGRVMFRDPEARLNKQFAMMFGLNVEEIDYDQPTTVAEVFDKIRKWEPEPEGITHGVFADSLAALSTEMELEEKDGMGMRRAKEFSEEMRKSCRIIANKGFLVVCSNQLRQRANAPAFSDPYKTPGGEAIGFYSSLRLRCKKPEEIKKKIMIAKKEVVRTIGVNTSIKVTKSSIWEPFHSADLIIMFDYGIDDIRANLFFIKQMTGSEKYGLLKKQLADSIDKACKVVEHDGLEQQLREDTIDLWEEIEKKFKQVRKPKERL